MNIKKIFSHNICFLVSLTSENLAFYQEQFNKNVILIIKRTYQLRQKLLAERKKRFSF